MATFRTGNLRTLGGLGMAGRKGRADGRIPLERYASGATTEGAGAASPRGSRTGTAGCFPVWPMRLACRRHFRGPAIATELTGEVLTLAGHYCKRGP